jgi:hypothetical protein
VLQILTREASILDGQSGGHERPTLCLTWELDPQTGKPVGRWVIEDTKPARVQLAAAA